MTPIEMQGLGPAERAYQLETGERVVVKITRAPCSHPGHVAMRACARLVDESGATLQVAGEPVVCAPQTRTLDVAALAEGVLTIPETMDALAAAVAERARQRRIALEAWAQIPAED